MGTQIHYELFKRVGAKGDCTMHDVLPSRERAIETAQELMKDEKATVVKVVKETYNDDTGDYLSLKIFEDGHNQVKVDPKAEDAPHALPCQVESHGKQFESLNARTPNHVEKAQTLLKLAATGIFTEGKLAGNGRSLILAYWSKPGFLAGYMATQKKDGEAQNSEKVMTELVATLDKIGISAETGLKSIAA